MNSRRFTFRKRFHLRRPADFARVFAQRCRARVGGLAHLYGARNNFAWPRLGLSVSRKHGNAVERNRLKRLIREAFRLSRHDLPAGLDLVLVPEEARDATLSAFREALVRAARFLHRKLPTAGGANSCRGGASAPPGQGGHSP
jgi:ribonuclease P protein component